MFHQYTSWFRHVILDVLTLAHVPPIYFLISPRYSRCPYLSPCSTNILLAFATLFSMSVPWPMFHQYTSWFRHVILDVLTLAHVPPIYFLISPRCETPIVRVWFLPLYLVSLQTDNYKNYLIFTVSFYFVSISQIAIQPRIFTVSFFVSNFSDSYTSKDLYCIIYFVSISQTAIQTRLDFHISILSLFLRQLYNQRPDLCLYYSESYTNKDSIFVSISQTAKQPRLDLRQYNSTLSLFLRQLNNQRPDLYI